MLNLTEIINDLSIQTKIYILILFLVILLSFMFKNWEEYSFVEKSMYSVMALISVFQIFIGLLMKSFL